MLTVDEAFRKFKSRLELNDREQKNASDRHYEVREYLEGRFGIERSFLTGSYARHTKTKPLKDIDIFFELKESERHYRSKPPSVVLTDFYDALVDKYGKKAVRKQGRSVNVDFGVVIDSDDNTDYRIVSVDGRILRRLIRNDARRHARDRQQLVARCAALTPRQDIDDRAPGLGRIALRCANKGSARDRAHLPFPPCERAAFSRRTARRSRRP